MWIRVENDGEVVSNSHVSLALPRPVGPALARLTRLVRADKRLETNLMTTQLEWKLNMEHYK